MLSKPLFKYEKGQLVFFTLYKGVFVELLRVKPSSDLREFRRYQLLAIDALVEFRFNMRAEHRAA